MNFAVGTGMISEIVEENTISGTTTEASKVTFDYTSESGVILIKSTGFPTVKLIKDSSYYLTQIVEEDNRTSTYGYTSTGLLATAQTDNGEKVYITYDTRNRVSSVTDCVTSDANILRKYTLEYSYMSTSVTNYFNVKKVYSFNGEGELVGQYELSNNEISNMRFVDKVVEDVKINLSNTESYLGYDNVALSGVSNQIISDIRAKNPDLGKGDFTFNTVDTFVLSFSYYFESALAIDSVKDKSYITIIQDDNELAKVCLSQKQFTEVIGSIGFKCNSTNPVYIQVNHDYNKGTFYVNNIRITQANILENYIVTNKYTGDNESTFEFDDNLVFYKYAADGLQYGDSYTSVNKRMYFEDLLENQKNISLTPSLFNLWYNKKRGLIANTTKGLIKYGNFGINILNLTLGTITINNGYTNLSYNTFSSQYEYKNECSIIAKNGNQITLDQKKYNKNNQVVESVD